MTAFDAAIVFVIIVVIINRKEHKYVQNTAENMNASPF